MGLAVAGALEQRGWTYDAALAARPGLDKAMLSRAVNGKPLSAANHLVVCRAFGLDPFAFLIEEKQARTTLRAIAKRLSDQQVTVLATRETGVET